jgi:hypothetical protein
MEEFERIKKIRKLQKEGYAKERKQSLVLNNFYAIITIGVVCLAIIIYHTYMLPALEEKKQRELLAKQKKEYFEQRAKQIALSQKLNQKKEQKDDTNK